MLLALQSALKETFTLCLKTSKAENDVIFFKDPLDFTLWVAIRSIHQTCFFVCLMITHDDCVTSLALPVNGKMSHVASEPSVRRYSRQGLKAQVTSIIIVKQCATPAEFQLYMCVSLCVCVNAHVLLFIIILYWLFIYLTILHIHTIYSDYFFLSIIYLSFSISFSLLSHSYQPLSPFQSLSQIHTFSWNGEFIPESKLWEQLSFEFDMST